MTCTVDPIVLVYALRYSLPRATGALGDVAVAIRRNWDELAAHHTLIEREVREELAATEEHTTGWRVLRGPEIAVLADLLAWIDGRSEVPDNASSTAVPE